MHDPVYRRGSRHRIGEDLLPLREDQVGSDAERAAQVPPAIKVNGASDSPPTGAGIPSVYDEQDEVIQFPENTRQLEVVLVEVGDIVP